MYWHIKYFILQQCYHTCGQHHNYYPQRVRESMALIREINMSPPSLLSLNVSTNSVILYGTHICYGWIHITMQALNATAVQTPTEEMKTAFGGRVVKEILKGISIYFNPGEMIGIMGPSGCGKTTFLDLLTARRKIGTAEVQYFSHRHSYMYIKLSSV